MLIWFHGTIWKFHHSELGREQKSETSVCAQCDQVQRAWDKIDFGRVSKILSFLFWKISFYLFFSSGTSTARSLSDGLLPFLFSFFCKILVSSFSLLCFGCLDVSAIPLFLSSTLYGHQEEELNADDLVDDFSAAQFRHSSATASQSCVLHREFVESWICCSVIMELVFFRKICSGNTP